MKKLSILTGMIIFFTVISYAQVGINTDASLPDPSAMLDIKSDTAGILIPRMTAVQRDAINNPATGLMVFVTDNNTFNYFDGNIWKVIGNGDNGSSFWSRNGNTIYVGQDTAVVIGKDHTTGDFEVSPSVGTGTYSQDVTTGGTVTAQEYQGSYVPEHLFDDNQGSIWRNDNNLPVWIQYDFGAGNEKAIGKYRLYWSGTNYDFTPYSWEFLASDDGTGWTTLDTRTGQNDWQSGTWKEFIFSNTQKYRYYRLNITDSNGAGSTGVYLNEMEMMEEVYADFTALYVEGDKTGIGTSSPDATLDINGTFQFTDGNEGDGKVMSSDADGNVHWIDLSILDPDWTVNGNDIYKTTDGNVGIGTTTPYYPLDINSTTSSRGTNIELENDQGGSIAGVYTNVNNTGTGSAYGMDNHLSGQSNGERYGVANTIDNSGTGNHFGVMNSLTGATTGDRFGTYNNLQGTGTGKQYGVRNELYVNNNNSQYGNFTAIYDNGDGQRYGTYNKLLGNGSGEHFANYNLLGGNGTGAQIANYDSIYNAGDAFHYGAYRVLNGSGSGYHYGNYNLLGGNGTGIQIATYDSIYNAGNAYHYGAYRVLNGNGSGDHYVTYNKLSGSGDGYQFGNFTEIDNSGNSMHFGIYNNLTGSGSGVHYGTYNKLYGSGSGDHFGIFNYVYGSGDGTYYASYNEVGGSDFPSSSLGTHYATYNEVRSNDKGPGDKYGSYNKISMYAGGTHYAVYGEAEKTGSYAGYFVGEVTTSKDYNYITPKSYKLQVPGIAFASRDYYPSFPVDFEYDAFKGSIKISGDSHGQSMAEIDLPQGAYVTSITAHVAGIVDGGNNFSASIRQKDFYDTSGYSDSVLGVSAQNVTTYSHYTANDNPFTVDNNAYSYYLIFSFTGQDSGDAIALHGVTIEYTLNKVSH